MAKFLLLAIAAIAAQTVSSSMVPIDPSAMANVFDGLGGLSGGGATTRLLVDYPEPARTQVLDLMFNKSFAASLQILKVEIGGDSQSTDGTESSHMHSADDLDYKRGYEWWLMSQAKQRNPDIKLYGLPWAYPGWVGGPEQSGSPFTHPDLTSNYILKWLEGARDVYGLEIDYIGIWNERASDADYAKTLRKTLDTKGFSHITLVAKDGGADICNDLAADADYAAAIGIIGLHYPSDYANYSVCHSLNKPIWASEESSSYDDINGAACWARVVTSHYVLNGMTASIMWNLVGSYFHGTNWYASSLLTAVQPWSGYYEPDMPVVWATAHITQFTEVGWRYLANNQGSGEMAGGGFYATLVDPKGSDWTLTAVKISRDHASCTRPKLPDFDVTAENITFNVKLPNGQVAPKVYAWYSNFEIDTPIIFQSREVTVAADGSFTLPVAVGDFWTVTTIATGRKGTFNQATPSAPQFPLPYTDVFDHYVESQEPHYFSDQIGAWEIHPSQDKTGKSSLRQMVTELPIGWSDHGSNGPQTLIGQLEWMDLTISTDFYIPVATPDNVSVCIGNRADQMWRSGVVICIASSGKWTLSYGGPALGGLYKPSNVVSSGMFSKALDRGSWHTLSLTTVQGMASASVNGTDLFPKTAVRYIDSGFSVLGMSHWYPIEFSQVTLSKAGEEQGLWVDSKPRAFAAGDTVGAANCSANGVIAASQGFELRSDWSIEHVASGMCAETDDSGKLTLQACMHGKHEQQMRNDYTHIRNSLSAVTLGAYSANPMNVKHLSGGLDGTVKMSANWGKEDWSMWVYFPNSKQLRNQYAPVTKLGFPMCLSVM